MIVLGLSHFRLCAAQEPAAGPPAKVLMIGKLHVGKILFLGNSITLHGPAPQIGWEGNWGMAASAPDKDYVHQLLDRVTKTAGGKPQSKIRNIADFERNFATFPIAEKLKDELAFEADVVILAIGENAASPKTDEERNAFSSALTNLLTELKKHGSPTIVVRSCFWPDAEKDALLKQTCVQFGGVFVDISKLGADPMNAASAEREIEHEGVAGHPGDRGMGLIADALWTGMKVVESLR